MILSELGAAPSIVRVAAFLGIHKSSVYRLLYAGELQVIKGFGRSRVCPKSIERFLARTGDHCATPRRKIRAVRALGEMISLIEKENAPTRGRLIDAQSLGESANGGRVNYDFHPMLDEESSSRTATAGRN